MDCGRADRAIEELFSDGASLEQVPALKEHLASCPACRAHYERDARLVQALGELEAVPASPDFTARVLGQLPDAAPAWQEASQAADSFWDRLRAAWESFRSGLSSPVRSRRLVPALVGVAALILVAALGIGLVTGGMQAAPGAAVGAIPWLAAGAALLVAVALVVGLIVLRRHK